MKKWTFVALLAVGATILGATVLREPVAGAASAILSVREQNVDADGNIKVHEQGTAAVKARQDGSWNVGISGVPSVDLDASGNTVKLDAGANGVRVANTADAPVPTRDTDNPARQQFNDMIHFQIPSGSSSDSGLFDLPQAKYLVITYVSGQAQFPSGQHPLFQLQFATFKHFLPFTLQVSPGGSFRDIWEVSEPLRAVYGPADHITAELSRVDTAGPADADVTVSGYLVNFP